MTELFIVIL